MGTIYRIFPRLEQILEVSAASPLILQQALSDNGITERAFPYRIRAELEGAAGVPTLLSVQDRITQIVTLRLERQAPQFLQGGTPESIISRFCWNPYLLNTSEEYAMTQLMGWDTRFTYENLKTCFDDLADNGIIRSAGKLFYLHKSVDRYLV